MEAAQSKAAADQASLALARRKADAIFGHNAPWENGGSRRAIMEQLTAGRTVLVRVTFPLGSLERMPSQLTVTRLGRNSAHWPVSALWEAPADPNFPGPGILALVDGSDLAQNDHVIATVPTGAPVAGVTVPSSAIVYNEDRAWVYGESGQRSYRRIPVDTANSTDGGYFIAGSTGLRPGTPVVVGGAGLLLARERNPSTEPEE
jgi:multidrug efflux pump subunit AcrA (membrane-fusion protein)